MFSMPLARLRLAGRLCRLGAWLIIVVGLVISTFTFFVTYYPSPYYFDPRQLLIPLAISGMVAILIFFFFICLFAIGALLDYVGTAGINTKQSSQEMSDAG